MTSRVARAVRKAFTHNLGLKLISLLLALAFFSLVRGSEDAQRSVFVDVVALLPPSSSKKILVSELPDRVKLTVQGSRSVIHALRSQDIPPVQIDLRSGTRSYYYFDPVDFEVPASVRIVQVAPSSIPLRWAERSSRRLPVEPRLVGQPGPDLSARIVEVRPSIVRVSGPAEEIDSLESAPTQPIDIRELGSGLSERSVGLVRPPPHAQFDVETVEVRVEVVKERATKEFTNLRVTVLGAQETDVRPARVDVVVSGESSRLEGLAADRVVPVVDARPLESERGVHELAVQVRGLPEGLEARVEPTVVLVDRSRGR